VVLVFCPVMFVRLGARLRLRPRCSENPGIDKIFSEPVPLGDESDKRANRKR